VHYGYFRAAKELNYETHWYDDSDDVSSVDFSDSIFITDHLVCANMPIRNDCVYFSHNTDLAFQKTNRDTEARLTHPKYYNFLYYSDRWNPADNISWPVPNEMQFISDKHYFHAKTNTITTIWATDLLKSEINDIDPVLFDERKNKIYFIGTKQGPNIEAFSQICSKHKKDFVNLGGWTGANSIYTKIPPSILDNVELVRNSYISVDIRDSSHLVQGHYYPCRLFKNISYGKWTGTNQEEVKDLFGDFLTYNENLEELYENLVEDSQNCSKEKMRDAMSFIAENHTYVNRLESLLSIV
jgi:hypothetical protein